MISLRSRRRVAVAAGSRGTPTASRWWRLLAAVAAGLVAGLGTVVGLGSPAAAHGQFVSSIPVAGSEVTEPLADLLLYFTEKPTSDAFFAVTTPSGVRVDRLWSHGPTRPLDPPVHEWYHEPDGDWVTRTYQTAYSARIPIAYWPEAGKYTVQYISVATDGQPVRGEFSFTYSGPLSPQPADYRPQRSEPDPILQSIAVTDAPTAPPSAPPIQDVIEEQEAGPGLWVLWVPVGLALAAALAILAFWRLRPQQARELVVSRFGGRYAAPSPRRPLKATVAKQRPTPGPDQRPTAVTAAARAALPASAAEQAGTRGGEGAGTRPTEGAGTPADDPDREPGAGAPTGTRRPGSGVDSAEDDSKS